MVKIKGPDFDCGTGYTGIPFHIGLGGSADSACVCVRYGLHVPTLPFSCVRLCRCSRLNSSKREAILMSCRPSGLQITGESFQESHPNWATAAKPLADMPLYWSLSRVIIPIYISGYRSRYNLLYSPTNQGFDHCPIASTNSEFRENGKGVIRICIQSFVSIQLNPWNNDSWSGMNFRSGSFPIYSLNCQQKIFLNFRDRDHTKIGAGWHWRADNKAISKHEKNLSSLGSSPPYWLWDDQPKNNSSFCWWFRNPQTPPGMVLKPVVNNGDIYHINWWVYRISEPSTVTLHALWPLKW